ncbi:hypothetical protein [Massilia sp. H6]|uniref:hypothetical protein n=1 Tax=Massilia sp. H6 TaxID=2970464 RepID=UPI002167E50F|nr:hypothetical protein [Massilia sp. H6]UVW28855.1 hypothetical protein NRS07_01510 [Massilia sp. H6]
MFKQDTKEAMSTEPALVPVSGEGINLARERCRVMVRKRALVSAGISAVPLPGMDILSDLTTFAVLVEAINNEFGLSQKQIERLNPQRQILIYKVAASVGGMLVGKMITRKLVLAVFQRAGVRMAARTVAKVVPLAGQVASAAIGFALFRKMGNQHVEACAEVARELESLAATEPGSTVAPM